MGRLEGKVAVITGAANGIGRAAAELFAANGASLVLVDRDEAAMAACLDGGWGAAAGVVTVCADVSQADSAERYVAAALDRFGRVDVALLNAGIEGVVAPIGSSPLDMFDRVMAVNVRGVWLGLSALLPAMRPGGGSIVITSSVVGLKAAPTLAPYGASKHAIVGLMRSAAVEGASHRIRVNTVHPGPVDTRLLAGIEFGRNAADPAAVRAASIARIPMGRCGQPADIAALMLFLASDEAGFVTGSTYVADGGWMA